MKPADVPDPDPTPARSLAAKLRDRYGCDLDPRIDLVAEPAPARPQPANPPSKPPSSTGATGDVLHRLVERSGASTRYRVAGEIARGGMGAILEVFDEDLRRRLAMKVILERAEATGSGGSSRIEPSTLARFL